MVGIGSCFGGGTSRKLANVLAANSEEKKKGRVIPQDFGLNSYANGGAVY